MTVSTINESEAAHFGQLAAEWWDPKGSSAMLHRLNPVRLGYIRSMVDAHFGADRTEFRPLSGKRALDVGCGAGLLCEPLARLGAAVTGLDAAKENIAAANQHSQAQGLEIDYRAAPVESLKETGFDLVTSLEVVEHVDNPEAFIQCLSDAIADDGVMIMSTPNRTPLSKMAMIHFAEGLGQIPKGTHDWDKFITPDELEAMLNKAGLEVIDKVGLSMDPFKGFVISDNISLNYLMTMVRS